MNEYVKQIKTSLCCVSDKVFTDRLFSHFSSTHPVNELLVLSDDCRYLVLLAKIQNKVDKNEDALLSLQRVSGSFISDIFHDHLLENLTALLKRQT